MVRRVSETARTTQWACAAASTVTEDRILMLLMTLKKKHRTYENADNESAYNESQILPGSNLGRAVVYSETFHAFPQSLQANGK
jgi:hypothetical protein